MFTIVLLSVLGLSLGQTDIHLPNGHDMKTVIDAAFNRIDHNPKDGSVNLAEFEEIVQHDDTNKDSCVTLAEFEAARSRMPDGIAEPMYHHFNPENNNCLNVADMIKEFNLMDHNHDGEVIMHEFEQYYSHILKQLFGHNNNGHGHTN